MSEKLIVNDRVAVLGATGKVGSQVLLGLSKLSIPAKALTRDKSKEQQLPDVGWMVGDVMDENILRSFLQGCSKLFLNTGVVSNMVEQQNRIIDVAKQEGIQYIIKLSTPAARQHSKDPVGEWHWHIEEHLKSSGLLWNVLQPQQFMQNWLGEVARTVKEEKKIYETTGKGKRAFTDTRDIGEVAAKLFKDPGSFVNQIIPLSGPFNQTYNDVAKAISKAIGETIVYVDQTREEAIDRMKKRGLPEQMINVFLAISENQRNGVAEKLISDNVKIILGKEGRSIYDFAQDHSQYFK